MRVVGIPHAYHDPNTVRCLRVCAIIHFGTDGWRARVDEDFTADNVARIADAVGELWQKTNPGKTVYIGFDTRPLAREFAELAAGALAAHGLDAVLASRPVPTPALTWAAAYDGEACGALMVTGSHHPQGYLCLKIRMGDGSTANQDVIEELEETMAPEPMGIEGQYRTADIIPDYMQAVASFVDAEAIRAAHLRVVVDPMGGAAQGYLADLLRELGVEVHEIHAGQASDQEDICPDPVEPWVDTCERTVIEDGACVGLVTDGDADRIGAVDERGRYIHPHQIMALVLGDLVQFRNLEGRVVVNLSCSTLVRRIAEALGCRVTVKPVGFKYIAAEMKKGGVLMGGEEAGGIGIAAHMPERDGILACLILCELMAKTDVPLGVLVDQLEDSFGKTSYGRRDLRLEAEDAETLRTLLPGVNPKSICGKVPQNVSHMDGLRLSFEDDTWLLVRPSGTEPVVRVYAEGFSVEERDELLDAGCALARGTYPL